MSLNFELISVVVPVYNVKPYLNRCIMSLLEQSYPNMEIILVDDGSVDGSGDICDEWSRKYDKLKVIHKSNGGVSSARNTGMLQAKGKYIGFVDPDDYVEKNMYLIMHKLLVENEADVVVCTWKDEYEGNEYCAIKNSVDAFMSGTNAIEYEICNKMYVTWNKLFTRDVCSNVLYNESVINGEDRLFVVETFLKAGKVIYIDKPLYHYFHRENSAGTKSYTSKDMSLITACNEMKKMAHGINYNLDKILSSQLHHAYVQLLSMMQYDVKKYGYDGEYCVKEIRRGILSILLNSYNTLNFKIKAIIICCFPCLIKVLFEYKNRRI